MMDIAHFHYRYDHARRGQETANAKSVTGIMGLNVTHGDKIQIVASGVDAAKALAELAPAIAGGLGDEGMPPMVSRASITQAPEAAPAPRRRSEDPNTMLGVSASPGQAVGRVFQLRTQEIAVDETGGDAIPTSVDILMSK